MKSALLFILFFSLRFLYAQDGELDFTFSDDGVYTLDFSGTLESGKAVVIRPDGKILIAGVQNDSAIFLLQLNADGSNDATFGTDGLLFLDDYVFVYNGTGPKFLSMKLQADNKILIAGSISHPDNWGVMGLFRLLPNGSPDFTFGEFGDPMGIDLGLDEGYEMQPRDFTVQSDGKIVVTANYSAYSATAAWDRPFIKRYNTDGTLDITFNDTGYILGDEGERADGIAVQNDGKILVSTGQTRLYRYNADGSIDSTFSSDGIVNTYNGGTYDQAIFVEPDGKILIGFEYGAFYIYKYTADGHLDNEFNIDGKTSVGVESHLRSHPMAIAPDGKIVVAGYDTGFEDDLTPELARLNKYGELDFTFNDDGYASTEFDYFSSYFATAVQPDGKIICIGTSYGLEYDYGFIAARYNGSVSVGINNDYDLIPNFNITPNPVIDNLVIKFHALESTVVYIDIFEMTGKKVFTNIAQVAGGDKSINLNIDNLTPGTYTIKMQSNSRQYTQLLMKE